MKKIYIDLSVSGNNNGFVSGAGEYGIVIFSELKKKLSPECFYVGAKHSVNLDNSLLKAIPAENIIRYKNIDSLNKFLTDNDINVIFLPQLIHEHIDIKSDADVIAVLHDLGDILDVENNKKDYYGKYYELPFFQKFKFFIKTHMPFLMNKIISNKVCAYNELITNFKNLELINVSHYSKATMKYYLSKNTVDSQVFYSPIKVFNYYNDNALPEALKTRFDISEGNYFLFCNAKRVRKNNSIALIAFDRFITRTGRYDLKAVVLGSSSKYEKYILSKLKNKSNFVFDEYIDKDYFEALYKFAHLFVFPSLLEGFGYPPVEAMKYGTLCACSSLTSISEICQDAVIYFDPFDIRSIELAYYQSFDNNLTARIKLRIADRYSCLAKRQKDDLNKLIELIIS